MLKILEGGRFQEGVIYSVTVWDYADSSLEFWLTQEGLGCFKEWLEYNMDSFIDIAMDTNREFFLNKDNITVIEVNRIK